MIRAIWTGRVAMIGALAAAVGTLAWNPIEAAVPGIGGQSFSLVAGPTTMSQPDGNTLYTWGYGCTVGSTLKFVGAGATTAPVCPTAQIPGPTLVVTQGQQVTVTLADALPTAAGNTSIVFAGQSVAATGGVRGMLAQEATPSSVVTYTFTPTQPGTFAYYSGTQADLQIEMGLYGAVVVLPATPVAGAACQNFPLIAAGNPLSLSSSAYGNPNTCYDREYLFQFHEMTSAIHDAVKAWVDAQTPGPIAVKVEPYQPNYFMINGRSLPDDLDSPYSPAYPNQPYNGNPHMHPNEQVLIRVIGQGRIQHPFHIHGNHARVLGRDGNLILSQTPGSTNLAGPLEFTIPTVSGQAVDAIFTWSGKGLNWDVYGHTDGDGSVCTKDANGFFTGPAAVGAANYGEYCADHLKPIPVTPPDPNIVANGQWYGGTPYLGIQGNNPTPQAPGVLKQNTQAGYAYMWHSHDEREITTNNVFPGGMMMMLIIDAPSTVIDENQ